MNYGNYSNSIPVCAVYQRVRVEVQRVTIKAFPGVPMFGSDVHPQRFFIWTSFTTVSTTYYTWRCHRYSPSLELKRLLSCQH